ncbi:MAG: MFS transporter, partial [Bilophila sp.]
FLVYAAAVLLTRPISGKIFDSRGENVIVYPTLLLTSLGMLALGVAESDWTMLCAGCLSRGGLGNFQSSAQAISLSLVPKDRFGQATSTFFIFFDMGLGFGPYIFGSLVPEVGYGGVYKIASGIALASIALYYLMHGRKQRTEM